MFIFSHSCISTKDLHVMRVSAITMHVHCLYTKGSENEFGCFSNLISLLQYELPTVETLLWTSQLQIMLSVILSACMKFNLDILCSLFMLSCGSMNVFCCYCSASNAVSCAITFIWMWDIKCKTTTEMLAPPLRSSLPIHIMLLGNISKATILVRKIFNRASRGSSISKHSTE